MKGIFLLKLRTFDPTACSLYSEVYRHAFFHDLLFEKTEKFFALPCLFFLLLLRSIKIYNEGHLF